MVTLRVSSPTFVGRAEELRALDRALDAAAAGRPRTVLVAGESGVGKTRLLSEFAGRARERGARVLAGDCIELGEGELPFAPLVGILRGLVRDLEPAELDRVLGSARADLATLHPALADRAAMGFAPAASRGSGSGGAEPAVAVATDQARLFERVLGVLGRLASDTPVVLIVEDLHWADQSTRDLLGFLIRSLHNERLALAASYRSDELHRRHPLRPFLAQHRRAAGVDRVELRRFERAELADQLRGILGKPAPEAVVERLHERSEGNAFFAEELLAAAGEGERAELPHTLRDALMVRIETLAEPTQHVLRTAAAIGRRAGHRLLSATAGLGEAALDGALREAVEHHVLEQREHAYEFRHALLREAVYADLLPGERVRLHELIARRLAEQPELAGEAAAGVGGGAVELAYHWRAAGDASSALAASVTAGRAAEAIAAAPEAQRQFEHALRLWERVPDAPQVAGIDHAELLHRAAEAAHLAGENGRAAALGREALAAADRSGDQVRSGLLLGCLGQYMWETGRSDEALALVKEAAATVPAEPPTAERARVLAEQSFMLVLLGRASEARPVCEEAVAAARQAGARAEECRALAELGHCYTMEGHWARGEQAIRDSLPIALELRLPAQVGTGYGGLGDTIDRAGRVEEAAALALEAVELARELGTERSFGVFQLSEASDRLLRLGRHAEAERAALTALELRPSGVWGRLAHEAAARVAVFAGELDRAAEHLERARAGHDPGSGPMWTGPLETVAAELALARRRPEEACSIALEEISGGQERGYSFYVSALHWLGVRAHADLAERARALGDATALAAAGERAATLIGELRELVADRPGEGPAPPVVQTHMALCEAERTRLHGEPDPSVWAPAGERAQALGMAPLQAYARWREAEAAVATGDRERAETALRAAASLPAPQSLRAEIDSLARRARLDLGAKAAAPAGEDSAATLGLTDRELEVLRLVAAGRTNKEIGAELYMSPKTASAHVSHILVKLGVRGRVEAAAAAHRLGLLDSEPVA